MSLPGFDERGCLPAGIHMAALEEIGRRFGGFRETDHRPQLWAKLQEFAREAKVSRLIESFLIDGSFVTAEAAPNDIDLIVVVTPEHNFLADLPPFQYNVLSQHRVRRRFGFDIVVAKAGTENLENAIAFFQQVKQRPGEKKGIVRLTL